MAFRRPLLVSAAMGAILVPVLLAGCASSDSDAPAALTGVSSAPVGDLETQDLTVYALPTTDSSGLYVAQYMGYFAKQGLTVTIKPATNEEADINQMALGKIDLVGANYVPLIEAQETYDDGVPTATGIADPTYQQVSADLDLFAEGSSLTPDFQGLFVSADSPIKTLSELKGKTIAINQAGGEGYVMVASALQADGLQPTEVKWESLPYSDMASALISGKVAAAYLPEPFNSVDEEQYGFTSLSNLDVGLTVDFPVEGYATTKIWARAHPNTLTAFYRALEEGQEVADTNRQIAEKATADFVPGITANVASLIALETYLVGPVDEARVQRVSDDMQLLRLSSTSMIWNISQLIGDNS
jgi:NitT/TauT family transport system substrate-binding protein